MSQKVSIIGLGYVGLPLAYAIAKSNKYEVVGFDIVKEKIQSIQNGILPIDDEQAEKDMQETKLSVSVDKSILKNSDFYIICVPTPIDNNYNPDFTPVKKATALVAEFLEKGQTVIVESTINPGVCEEVVLPILEKTGLKNGEDFELAHCPERINPGDPKWNVYNIPRNVGALTKKGCKNVADLYRNCLTGEINEMATLQEAEATKIIENTFRDINIAYVNELAKSFDKLGIDLVNVIKGASNKPFAFMAHYPGCGVGGHCIAVDPYYLIEKAKQAGFDHKFLRNARMVNNSMPAYAVERLIKTLNNIGKSIKGTKIGLMGLSYKPNIEDLRESPALKIKEILEREYETSLNVFDPYNLDKSTHQDIDSFLDDCEVVVIATAHSEFKELPLEKWKKVKVIVDGRNCLNKAEIKKLGVVYSGIGR